MFFNQDRIDRIDSLLLYTARLATKNNKNNTSSHSMLKTFLQNVFFIVCRGLVAKFLQHYQSHTRGQINNKIRYNLRIFTSKCLVLKKNIQPGTGKTVLTRGTLPAKFKL